MVWRAIPLVWAMHMLIVQAASNTNSDPVADAIAATTADVNSQVDTTCILRDPGQKARCMQAGCDVITQAECFELAKSVYGSKVSTSSLQVGSWSDRPTGCSVHSNNDCAAYFNTHATGASNSGYTQVCLGGMQPGTLDCSSDIETPFWNPKGVMHCQDGKMNPNGLFMAITSRDPQITTRPAGTNLGSCADWTELPKTMNLAACMDIDSNRNVCSKARLGHVSVTPVDMGFFVTKRVYCEKDASTNITECSTSKLGMCVKGITDSDGNAVKFGATNNWGRTANLITETAAWLSAVIAKWPILRHVCYSRIPSNSCPNNPVTTPLNRWTRDTYGETNRGAATDKAACETTRKHEINGWCGITDTEMAYVAIYGDLPSEYDCPPGEHLTEINRYMANT